MRFSRLPASLSSRRGSIARSKPRWLAQPASDRSLRSADAKHRLMPSPLCSTLPTQRGRDIDSLEAYMAKVLCVLYPDPVTGYPKSYAREGVPKIERYPNGQTAPTPKRIDFKPGELLGSVTGELGLRKFLEQGGHKFVVTSDKEGANSVFDKELPDADIVIS